MKPKRECLCHRKRDIIAERKRVESNALSTKERKTTIKKDIGTIWSQVVGRETNKNGKETTRTAVASQRKGPAQPSRKVEAPQKKRRLPRTSAVVITCPPGQYDENLSQRKD